MEKINLLLINSGIVLGVTFSDIEMILKILLLSASLTYTIWKFFTEWKKHKNEK
jgi:hypothetical protein